MAYEIHYVTDEDGQVEKMHFESQHDYSQEQIEAIFKKAFEHIAASKLIGQGIYKGEPD